MSKSEEELDGTEGRPVKSPWERPTLTRIGNVKDLVQGSPKSGAHFDSDPANTTKSGVG